MGDKMTSVPEHVGPSGGEGVLGTFKNILILADSSVVTEWLAAYLAKAFVGAQYHVLGVSDPLIKHFARIPMSEAEMLDAARGASKATCRYIEGKGIECTSDVVEGEFHEVVPEFIEENGIDLLAMVAYHDKATDRAVLTDSTYDLLKVVDLPILLVSGPVEPQPPKTVLVLTDEDGCQVRPVRAAVRMANQTHGSVSLMYMGDEEGRDGCIALAREAVAKHGMELRVVEGGESTETRVAAVDAHDLLVVSRGGTSLLDHLLLTLDYLPVPKAEREIIKRCHTPILLVAEQFPED